MTKITTVDLFPGKQHVFLATPSYDGKVGHSYTVSLATSLVALQAAGIGVTYSLMGGNCHVDDARNGLVREFMLTDCTDLVFLDSDIGWRGEDLIAMLLHNRDMVAGVYPKKTPDGMPVEFPITMPPNHPIYSDADGLVEVLGVPTGFLRIRRNVIEHLLESHGQRKYVGQGAKEGDMPYTILFERTYEAGARRSGDYAFCRKWISEGGKIYVDPRYMFVHEGEKEWSGTLGDHWLEVYGIKDQIKEAKFIDALQAVKANSYQVNHLIDLVEGWGSKWGGEPELLEACITLARQATGPIIECGSGLTTILMALVSDQPIISFEQDPVWGSYAQGMLDKHGLKATIRCKPLKSHDTFEWYDMGGIPLNASLVVCDGPPRMTRGGRTGVVELAKLLPNATYILDDPARDTIGIISGVCPVEFEWMGSQKPIAVSRVKHG